MTQSSTITLRLLAAAINGDNSALGSLLTRFRPLLKIQAERKLDERLASRVDASDIVQITCLEVQRDLGKFRGVSVGEFVKWTKTILDNNVGQCVQQHIVAQKRSTNKERRLDDKKSPSAKSPIDFLPSEQSSPSHRAMWSERAAELAAAMEQLPEDQRTAVRLKHLEGYSLARLAEHFDRSEVAAAGLLKRGLQGLRKILITEPVSGSDR